MKKLVIIVLLIAAAAGIALAFANTQEDAVASSASYLRVHIRANSNGADDQAVKYKVRDGVVEYLAPTVAACENKQQAIAAVTAQLSGIEAVAERILKENGYSYGARARVCEERFPTRVYEGVTLAAGVYDALILELGSGKGDNWWCVVYPPLCFTGGSVNVVYRSKIAQIIRQFFGE